MLLYPFSSARISIIWTITQISAARLAPSLMPSTMDAPHFSPPENVKEYSNEPTRHISACHQVPSRHSLNIFFQKMIKPYPCVPLVILQAFAARQSDWRTVCETAMTHHARDTGFVYLLGGTVSTSTLSVLLSYGHATFLLLECVISRHAHEDAGMGRVNPILSRRCGVIRFYGTTTQHCRNKNTCQCLA